jgi:excisionase family DNA binding protein
MNSETLKKEESFDLRETLEILDISRTTLYRWMKEGRIKGNKFGGQWQFPKVEIYNLLEESPVEHDETIMQSITNSIKSYKELLNEMGVDEEEIKKLIPVDRDQVNEPAESEPAPQKLSKLLFDLVLITAITQEVSDIHIELCENYTRIRHRDTGNLFKILNLSGEIHSSLVREIKKASGCNPAVTLIPQDGAFGRSVGEREYVCRVSFFPCADGESVVIRLLNKDISIPNIENLGLNPHDVNKLKEIISRKSGLIIFTGPTGSGKTTFLYSCLKEINTENRNVMTIEDPIELQFPGMNQSQVRADKGYTFPMAIRSMLRHDPDVIMVGEVRDDTTLKLLCQASSTGHLVFTSLHSKDTIDTIQKMKDLGIDLALMRDALTAVIATRIVRKICPKCSEKMESGSNSTGKTSFIGKGCKFCHGSGYKGAGVLCELLELTEDIKSFIFSDLHSSELRKMAVSRGLSTLESEANKKISEGITTPEEINRVLK